MFPFFFKVQHKNNTYDNVVVQNIRDTYISNKYGNFITCKLISIDSIGIKLGKYK